MSFALKLLCMLALVLVTGVPVIETWEAILLMAGVMALVFGTWRPGWSRVAAMAGIVALVIGLKALLPRADIAEAHNAFLVIGEGEPLQRELPPVIFARWKTQFDAIYPPDPEPYEPRSAWRMSGVPRTLFTSSTDALWRTPKYTRQVDDIRFRTLGQFRAGFANDGAYNYWTGELRRESMPFYVMYELTPAAVGSSLAWRGEVFWQRGDGGFDHIVHADVGTRPITDADVGKLVYAAFFPTPGELLTRNEELYFELRPSMRLRLARWVQDLLTILGVVSILALTVRPRWPSYLRALSILAAAYAVMAGFITISLGKFLGKTFPPQGGGDDGLAFEAWGKAMAFAARAGDWYEAMRGGQDIYSFTPGMRYFRMIEKFVFGDTNHLYALLVACVPIVVFYLCRHLLRERWAWVVTGVFLLLPVGNLSYLKYLTNAKLGYGEAAAMGLLLLGLVLLLRTESAWGGRERSLPTVWLAGLALAASMILRPNVSYAVIWLGAAYSWMSWNRGDLWRIVVLGCGLALALWMPLHNWIYGGRFVLIMSNSADVFPIGIGEYVSAFGDLLRGRLETEPVKLVAAQMNAWLSGPGPVIVDALLPAAWVAYIARLSALAVTCWVAVRWLRGRCATDLGIVAVAALCAHVPLLFIFDVRDRYAMPAWDLCLVTLIVVVVRQLQARPRVVPRPAEL